MKHNSLWDEAVGAIWIVISFPVIVGGFIFLRSIAPCKQQSQTIELSISYTPCFKQLWQECFSLASSDTAPLAFKKCATTRTTFTRVPSFESIRASYSSSLPWRLSTEHISLSFASSMDRKPMSWSSLSLENQRAGFIPMCSLPKDKGQLVPVKRYESTEKKFFVVSVYRRIEKLYGYLGCWMI